MDPNGNRIPLSCTLVGIDEVGRGALAGPAVVAGVRFRSLPANDTIALLDDSKKLSAGKRRTAQEWILESCDVAVVEMAASDIDHLGIGQALYRAMARVADVLDARDILVDGNVVPPTLKGRARCLTKADATEPAVAAASIVAKEHRDALMRDLAVEFPVYQWDRNVGYGSAVHRDAIVKYGPCAHHRTSFLRKILAPRQGELSLGHYSAGSAATTSGGR